MVESIWRSAAQVDAFICDIESLDEAAEPAPLPRTASGTPTIPPPSEAAAFRKPFALCALPLPVGIGMP